MQFYDFKSSPAHFMVGLLNSVAFASLTAAKETVKCSPCSPRSLSAPKCWAAPESTGVLPASPDTTCAYHCLNAEHHSLCGKILLLTKSGHSQGGTLHYGLQPENICIGYIKYWKEIEALSLYTFGVAREY